MKGTTKLGTSFWTESFGGAHESYQIHAQHGERQAYVGTVLKLVPTDQEYPLGLWETIAFGVWHESGRNGIEVFKTLEEAVEFAVHRSEPALINEARRSTVIR